MQFIQQIMFNSLFKKKTTIANVKAYEVLDSRGFPTVACMVTLENGIIGKAMVPSGASTGEREALEMRDGDKKRFIGKGVLKAVEHVNQDIAPRIIGLQAHEQNKIDELMISADGTPNKSKYGANAILAVSLAIAHASAKAYNKPLYRYIREDICKDKNEIYNMPVPMLNVINGGAHADNTIDFQEFMFMPIGAKSIRQACQMASECFHALMKILKSKNQNTNKGDEGGFAPDLRTAEDALELMVEAIKAAGYKPGVNKDVAIALDVAASELYDNEAKVYIFKKAIDAKVLSKAEGTKTTDQMIEYLISLTKKFPIISIEDGLSENDWDGFSKLTQKIGNSVQIVGDDLFCTNPKILTEGVQKGVANAILIKLNQIGSLTETIQAINIAKANNWCAVVSHRSGETEDTTIADLSVALGTGQIKTGSMSRSERICKYNRLMEIEDELSVQSRYNGVKTFNNLKK
ncbi:enolase [Candidatus Malacoplasma girerdii]|uniref:Enolase n=1 Tax=Candidatus Malacoplasma girerdii TaxID=1318617 RepID=A0A097SSC9_9BACT|nr:enolase [Candidatus Malacoplasma girerdii]ASJ89146.1 MAG: enolase [Candidatus Malacoplasma girerdii]